MNGEKVYKMDFTRVYPLLVAKAEKKGRTKAEVDEAICWLTGYGPGELKNLLKSPITYEEFFASAPAMNPERKRITGTVCGVRVEEIEEPLMRDIRYLDKLVDELAKGRSMDKVLRRDCG